MGSVKDLVVLEKPKKDRFGKGKFIFSDDYSVFDYGKMPDSLNDKGKALCLIGAYLFEKSEDNGTKTHYRGLVNDKGKVVSLDELKKPTNAMEIDLVRVIPPKFENGQYYYSMFTPELKNYLIPLEIIYRNSLPEGSSIFRRLKKGGITTGDLGLAHYPEPGEKLEKPYYDVSTKLEETDRYITWKEAQEIGGLTGEEIEEIKEILLDTNNLITDVAGRANLDNEDGKIELGVGPEGELVLVDVIGTPDECRFTYDGLQVSKELARKFYRNSDWYDDTERAKKSAEEQGMNNWKNLCTPPPELDLELKMIISDMYPSAANAIIGKELFDSPKLGEVVKEYKDYLESNQM